MSQASLRGTETFLPLHLPKSVLLALPSLTNITLKMFHKALFAN